MRKLFRLASRVLFVFSVLNLLLQLLEQRILLHIAATPDPPGWRTPLFPEGHEILVPASDGAVLSVAVAGPDDGPVAALAHGITQNHHNWGLVAEPLVDAGWRVVGVNQRGHAASTVGTDGYSAGRLGADLGDVIEALDLRDVVVAGHSLGGIATLSLLTGPRRSAIQRVRAAVLVSTTASANDPARRATAAFVQRDLFEILTRHPEHGRVMRRFAFGPTPSPAMVDALGAAGQHLSRADELAAATSLLDYDVRSELAGITADLTVLCGTRDAVTPLRDSKTIARESGATLLQLPGVGHMLPLEAPDAVVDAIQAHLPRRADTHVEV